MTDNFDDMMEYVEGYKPREGDVFDFIEYKVTKGKIIFVRRKGQEEFVNEFHGEYMGSLELENGKTVGFLCKDGSVKVLPDSKS